MDEQELVRYRCPCCGKLMAPIYPKGLPICPYCKRLALRRPKPFDEDEND